MVPVMEARELVVIGDANLDDGSRLVVLGRSDIVDIEDWNDVELLASSIVNGSDDRSGRNLRDGVVVVAGKFQGTARGSEAWKRPRDRQIASTVEPIEEELFKIIRRMKLEQVTGLFDAGSEEFHHICHDGRPNVVGNHIREQDLEINDRESILKNRNLGDESPGAINLLSAECQVLVIENTVKVRHPGVEVQDPLRDVPIDRATESFDDGTKVVGKSEVKG